MSDRRGFLKGLLGVLAAVGVPVAGRGDTSSRRRENRPTATEVERFLNYSWQRVWKHKREIEEAVNNQSFYTTVYFHKAGVGRVIHHPFGHREVSWAVMQRSRVSDIYECDPPGTGQLCLAASEHSVDASFQIWPVPLPSFEGPDLQPVYNHTEEPYIHTEVIRTPFDRHPPDEAFDEDGKFDPYFYVSGPVELDEHVTLHPGRILNPRTRTAFDGPRYAGGVDNFIRENVWDIEGEPFTENGLREYLNEAMKYIPPRGKK